MGVVTFVASIVFVAGSVVAASAEAEPAAVALEARVGSGALARRHSDPSAQYAVSLGVEIGRDPALITGVGFSAIALADAPAMLAFSPYAGVRLPLGERLGLDLTGQGHLFVGIGGDLERSGATFVSRDTFGFGVTGGVAGWLRLSKSFRLRVTGELGAATFDYDELSVRPAAISSGYRGGALGSFGLAIAGLLPL